MKTLDQRKNAEFGWNGNKFLPLFLMLVPLRKEWIAIQEKESQIGVELHEKGEGLPDPAGGT